MKLPLREPEHEALRAELARWDGYVASALLAAEAVRACARYGAEYADEAWSGLDALALIPIDDDVLAATARIEPTGLRTLDAVHLATAVSLVDDLGTFVTYDRRLARAAERHGLTVARPE